MRARPRKAARPPTRGELPLQNIEIKAPLRDRNRVEAKLAALGARRLWTLRQRDTFFGVEKGWLKVREVEGRPGELISYRRSTEDAGPRTSEYDVIVVGDAGACLRLLGRVLPVEKVVAKERTLWIYEHTRVHLDRVEKLGDFIELETVVEGTSLGEARAESERVADTLGLRPEEYIAVPYRDLPGRE